MRYDLIAKIINSAMCLTNNCIDDFQKSHILNRAYEKINDLWNIEYKSWQRVIQSHFIETKTNEFWDAVKERLDKPLKLNIISDARVNPPSSKGGIVELCIKYNNSVEATIFKLIPE